METEGRLKRPRKAEPRIVDPATHPRAWVNLSVAAHFLEMDRRALIAYIDEGRLTVEYKGRRRKAHVDELVRFKAWLRRRVLAS